MSDKDKGLKNADLESIPGYVGSVKVTKADGTVMDGEEAVRRFREEPTAQKDAQPTASFSEEDDADAIGAAAMIAEQRKKSQSQQGD